MTGEVREPAGTDQIEHWADASARLTEGEETS